MMGYHWLLRKSRYQVNLLDRQQTIQQKNLEAVQLFLVL
jgi:hypothetical protein